MRAARILISWLIGGLIIGLFIWYLPPKLFPRYTARTFIRVLPGSYFTPIVALIKNQSTLESLVDAEKMQQTEWFQKSGKTKSERIAAAIADLHKHLCADALPDSDLVMVSMTYNDSKEAAAVLNEIVDSFLRLQQAAKRKQIAGDLMTLGKQEERFQRDFDLTEQTINDVRHRYGIYDLEQHNWPHPITERLMRLEAELDDCSVEIKLSQAQLEELVSKSSMLSNAKTDPNEAIKKLQNDIKLSQIKLTELQKMRDDASRKQEDLDVGRAQFAKMWAIRNERRQALDSIKSRTETLKIAYDNPDACGMQFVESAAVPRQTDMLPWQTVIPSAFIAAVIAGIVHLLRIKRA